MNPIILMMSDACRRLNYTNFGEVGKCLTEVTLQGDPILAGIVLSILFIGLLVRFNFPMTLFIPFGIALTYTLWLLSGSEVFLGLFMFSIMVAGAIAFIGLLKSINKWWFMNRKEYKLRNELKRLKNLFAYKREEYLLLKLKNKGGV